MRHVSTRFTSTSHSRKRTTSTSLCRTASTVSNLPAPQKREGGAVSYELKFESNKGELVISRMLRVDVLILQADQYPAVRAFFQFVRTGDDAQIMVQPQVAAASK